MCMYLPIHISISPSHASSFSLSLSYIISDSSSHHQRTTRCPPLATAACTTTSFRPRLRRPSWTRPRPTHASAWARRNAISTACAGCRRLPRPHLCQRHRPLCRHRRRRQHRTRLTRRRLARPRLLSPPLHSPAVPRLPLSCLLHPHPPSTSRTGRAATASSSRRCARGPPSAAGSATLVRRTRGSSSSDGSAIYLQ